MPPRATPEQHPERPVLVVSGSRAGLGPLRSDLVPVFQRWMNDPEIQAGTGRVGPVTLEDERAWYERVTTGPGRLTLVVYDLADLAPVGVTDLHEIDQRNGTAWFGIILGERRGQGLGTEATRLMLDWGFTALGLHNVMLQVFEWNRRALRAYERAGFRQIGRRRGAAVTHGRRHDVVLMDAVADEFTGSALAAGGGRPARP